ncbi:MAG: SUMF1/EgtB/PvdO family nonheme iron enzyme [Myxococcota bacterium]
MVRIPAGIFLMGEPFYGGNPEERPAHEAAVASFWLDETEVTLAAYRRCVAAGDCAPPHTDRRFCNAKYDDREDHPVNCVDLDMAVAYCAHVGKRLPSEREWEYAASGGAAHHRYSWGSSPPPDEKNNCYQHPFGSCSVKQYPPGAFGLYDMTGNAWEWTQSSFDPYPSRSRVDPVQDKRLYVYRGGSWSRRFPKWMKTTLRNRYERDQYSASIGFRCAQAIEPTECPPDFEVRAEGCERARGTPRCEADFAWQEEAGLCMPTPDGKAAALATRWPPKDNPANVNQGKFGRLEPRGNDGERAKEAAPITRSRTPEHDADCRQNWPGTPASYLFRGGHNYPSRKPAVRQAGCVPRDMSWAWTSACCPG